MNAQTSTVTGCGSSTCQCAGTTEQAAVPDAFINGIALHAPGQRPGADALRELAYSELLRQHAVMKGLLPRHKTLSAPELGEAERQVIEAMVDGEVSSPQPNEDECQRYYEANPSQFMVGQALHVRHILFAVTPGVNVHALTIHAEKALLELTRKDASPERFVQLAAELSNCPTSAQGGDLGWVGPDDCAPELANELFHQKHSQWGMGVHPRLIHTRFGFHIIEVLNRRAGKTPAYAEVRERIATLLAVQSRARALHQYMSLLIGEALVEGIALEGADSPLVQ
ncbi:peptidylprolyl isomerase [Polaromonas naphthalenivorans]|uniref:peptidylprolyl isomerase n=1 Tax=Polaromonas naphthalenivorans (strain CJ2) TaxID=365044 RepID=A1VTS5_POLNA|nr:peptidylprolyl isomerase [Polaromonas naphthalenivorans]ABM39053.1 PpiC-type peptidyl-prolyl cis-trans isomerase [Polaromonas naphthalenivorans CJ2]